MKSLTITFGILCRFLMPIEPIELEIKEEGPSRIQFRRRAFLDFKLIMAAK